MTFGNGLPFWKLVSKLVLNNIILLSGRILISRALLSFHLSPDRSNCAEESNILGIAARLRALSTSRCKSSSNPTNCRLLALTGGTTPRHPRILDTSCPICRLQAPGCHFLAVGFKACVALKAGQRPVRNLSACFRYTISSQQFTGMHACACVGQRSAALRL